MRTSESASGSDWAQRLGHLGALNRDHERRFEEPQATGPATWQRVGAVLIGLAVLAAIVIGGGRWLLSRSYYVGLEDERVVIYQGIPAQIGPLDLSWEYEETNLTVDDLPGFLVTAFREGRTAADLSDAERIVANARTATAETEPEPSPSPSPSQPSPAAEATP